MGKIFTQKITRWDGGISDDAREPASNKCVVVKHFDIYSNPYKISPYRSTEADTNDGSSSTGMKQYDVRDFQRGSDGKLYGLGKNGSNQPKIVYKSDPTQGNWTLPSSSEGNGAIIRGCFIEWASALWFFQGTNQVAKWTLAGSLTNTVSNVGSTIFTVAQGVVGPDNNLYLFYNNKVVRVTPAGAVEDDVCPALPSDMMITSVTPFQSGLAIGMASVAASGTTPLVDGISKVFVWDMVSDTTITDVYPWGTGALMCLGLIEGRLVGVSNNQLSSLGTTSFTNNAGSLVIRILSGGEPQIIKEVPTKFAILTGSFLRTTIVKDNRIYFVTSLAIGPSVISAADTTTHEIGIWSFGRKNTNGNFALSIDHIEQSLGSSGNHIINSFGNYGNYWFITHSNDGSITKTDDQASGGFTFTSAYETQIFGDATKKYKLIRVRVGTEVLPTAGQVVLKYRKDEETSYTTIFTNGTDNSLSHSAVNIESSGGNFPDFREIQFRLESTGNAEITQLYCEYEELDKDI